MHPETPETSDRVLGSRNNSFASSSSSQHGNQQNSHFEATPATPFEDYGGSGPQDTGSEWSFSTSSSTPSDDESRLNAVDAFLSQRALFDDDDLALNVENEADAARRLDKISKALIDSTRRHSPIQNCSQEILLHVLSHLPATDLLTIKLVSRRFYDLANSPYAWISAFSRYFPGSATIKSPKLPTHERKSLIADRRPFTRLSPVASWTSEYLLRTKLLRCLERGRPSLPFAAPSQGKPHKGFATFSFSSRLRVVTHLDAKFGPANDKRLPQFIHGSCTEGHVSISDRRGELVGWGLHHGIAHFRSFEDTYPGTSMWGAGSGQVIGLPNVMDLSSSNGMIYGEGLPGGYAYFLASNEKYGRILSGFAPTSARELGMPYLSQVKSAICSVWISQALAIPRQTEGLVGMFVGSSCGVISAFSLGLTADRGERLNKGELTARWILSPGVPIISIKADQNYTYDRAENSRIWAVAINALGEVFYLTDLPKRHPPFDPSRADPDILKDMRAWATGKTAPWHLVESSRRDHRPAYDDETQPPPYLPSSAFPSHGSSELSQMELNELHRWFGKDPSAIKALFNNWDMRQRLEVDFAGDDGNGAGEAIIVFRCGYEESFDDSPSPVSARRCVRQTSSTPEPVQRPAQSPSSTMMQSDWHTSHLVFGDPGSFKISATALDCSKLAQTTIAEDAALWYARVAEQESEGKVKYAEQLSYSPPPKIPGQRARIIAAGTTTGQVYLWNTRAAYSSAANVTNDITPLRVISTSSPSISSLALTALYLVHGGSEGLVQAWDPLGSTTEPIRTICSAMNRRALLASQQDPTSRVRSFGAVGAICLDPDSNLLRGIVALRDTLRYWSYSSSRTGKDITRAQKRRAQRMARGVKSNPSEGYIGGRRMDLKGFVSQEMVSRGIDEQEKRAEEKKNRRMNGRFGLDLLGNDASEEELIAYAKLLSEEEQERELQKSMEKHLHKGASEAEVRAHVEGLSLDDYEKWKYASWEERYAMIASAPGSATRNSTPTSYTPQKAAEEADDDLARAMELSLQETAKPETELQSSSKQAAADDVEEAIRRSLKPEEDDETSGSGVGITPEDQDFEEAIRLSLKEQGMPSPTTGLPRSDSFAEEEEFPPLGSSPVSSPPVWGRGKGKRRA